MKKHLLLVLCTYLSLTAISQQLWTEESPASQGDYLSRNSASLPATARFFRLHPASLRQHMQSARSYDPARPGASTASLVLPLPDGSLLPALLWGVAWANIIGGVPIEPVTTHGVESIEYTGTFFDLLSVYTLLGGVASLAIFFAHGALFLEIRTEGDIREKARAVAAKATPVAALLAAVFMAWTLIRQDSLEILSLIAAVVAVGSFGFAAINAKSQPMRAFTGTAVGIALYFIAQFIDLFPNAMVSSIDSAFDMSLNMASSTNYTLTVMTVVAGLLVPVVLLYQGWTYWVFRHRLSAEGFGDVKSPMDLLDQKKEAGSGPESDQRA